MPAKTEELLLIYRRERIRFDGSDVAILECETPEREKPAFADSCGGLNQLLDFAASAVIVKAECPPDDLVQGLSYRFYGHWANHERHGKQFQARTYVRCQPHGKAGVIRYLQTTCAGYGVGRATAEKLWDKFQGDAVRILREEPEVATAAVGMQHFTEEKAAAASLILKEESALEDVSIDLIDLLGGRGFPKDTAKKTVGEWGNKAAVLVRKNPYLLMRFRGCGFGLTDKLYLDQGGNPAALKRQALCAWNAIARETEGHTWYRPEFVEMSLRGRIAGASVRPMDAMKLAKRAGALSVLRDETGRPWIAEARKARNERSIAEAVQVMLAEQCRWPEVAGLDCTEHQQTEAAKALVASIGILAGSPGTGKAQPLDAKVLTPKGWTKMRYLHVGSKVIGADGKPTEVIGIHPQGTKPVYRVTFSDGVFTECTPDHLWFTTTRKERQRHVEGQIRDTEQIRQTLDRGDGSLTNHQIPMTAPIEFEQREYTLHPYLMGLLLGDGCFRGGYPKFTNPEEYLVDAVRSLLPIGVDLRSTSNPIDYAITGTGGPNIVSECLKSLRLMGKLSIEKHIPKPYLLGSSINRLSLLQGLLDTDGSTDGHNIEFSTSSKQLAEDFVFLVQSLGGTTTNRDRIPVYEYKGEKKNGARSYRILVMLPASIQPFRLPRKLERYIPRTKYPPRRYIESVEMIGEKPCQCISVANADGLYLTNDCIVTHNTYTLARLVGRLIELCGPELIAVCAPTGKAAVRITEALEGYQIRKSASTIHRLLGVASRTAGEGWGFKHDENDPLPHKWIIVDEASMISVDLMASLYRACGRGTHVLLVGDTNQLPPVEHGRPLYDLIQAGIPTGELREIRRNSGLIVEMCAAIRDAKPFRFAKELNPDKGDNIICHKTGSNAASLEAMVEKLHRLPRVGIDPVWQCQVLVMVNKKSELSRVEVNKRLQGELNPNGARAPGCPFRVGDKIIRMKRNTLMPIAEDAASDENTDQTDGKVLVCNGEMGQVVQVESKRAWARFTGPKRAIVIPFGGNAENEENSGDNEEATSTGCDFDLGYGITIHKSQGSEWPVVFMGLDDSGGAMRLGSRELFYTGISRGGKQGGFDICFGKEHIARAMCSRQVLIKRKTFLRELIQGVVK